MPLVLAVGVLASRLSPGSSPRESFGAYWELWRGYDPLQVAKWFVYHLADFEIYLAVIPLAVAPIVLWSLLREGRAGSERSAAFAALFLSANTSGSWSLRRFNSTPYAYDRLHDRYAFYFIPLWLIVFVAWLARGLPRPLVATATGVVLALALPAILPVPASSRTRPASTPCPARSGSGSRPRRQDPERSRAAPCSPCSSSGSSPWASSREAFASSSPSPCSSCSRPLPVFAWERMIDAPENAVLADGLEPAWIDERLPGRCARHEALPRVRRLPRFQPHPARAVRNRVLQRDGRSRRLSRRLDSRTESRSSVSRSTSGRLVFEDGSPLVADFVYTQPGIELYGERLATERPRGSCSGDGRRGQDGGAETTDDVRTADCA